MQFGLIVQMTGSLGFPQPLARLAREAEAAGWDGFFIWDVFRGDAIAPTPVVEPWIAMAAIAAATERIRFGPMVTPLPRRRPWKLAREAASLDHLSNGRLILGVGIGDQPEEFSRFGEAADPRVRARMLDEGLEVLTGLWSGEAFSHHGEHYRIDKLCSCPGRAATTDPDLGWRDLAAQTGVSAGRSLGRCLPRQRARQPDAGRTA
jgi:alkanesulfonate monooxygenase SsuD/methylene tetrahydromethanopterin reductase-like flavin-dependent oxidoreductase (luciferase family)